MTSSDCEPLASAMKTVVWGAVTVAFQTEGRVVNPLKVMLLTPLKTTSPVMVTAFASATAVVATTEVLLPSVSVPVPTGPPVTTAAVVPVGVTPSVS